MIKIELPKLMLGIFILLILFVSFFNGSTSINTLDQDSDSNKESISTIDINQKRAITSDQPITITGNDQFTNYANSGNGSLNAPFIIENYYIYNTSNSNGNGVEIRNTDKFFILKNITIDGSLINGFYLDNVSNAVFEDNKAININKFDSSLNPSITNFNNGFYVTNSKNNNFINNTGENNFNSFILDSSSMNTLINCHFENNKMVGIDAIDSNDNQFVNNTIITYNNGKVEPGISLTNSKNNTLTGNIFVNNGLYVFSSTIDFANQNNVSNNIINGKNLIFLQNKFNESIKDDSGQIILVNCSYITIEKQNLTKSFAGIELLFSNNSIMQNNIITNSYTGIYLGRSYSNQILNNKLINNSEGIHSYYSNSNNYTKNNLDSNENGFFLLHSDNSKLNSNIINNSVKGEGFFIYDCDNTNLMNNVANYNSRAGFSISYSTNTNLQNNIAESNEEQGFDFLSSTSNVLLNNTAIYNNLDGFNFASSDKNTLESNNATKNNQGFNFKSSNANIMKSNFIIDNLGNGILLNGVTNSNLTQNVLFHNSNYGIYITGMSYNDFIYLNSFISNGNTTSQAYSSSNLIYWSNSTIGNFWSDYNGTDLNNDGIGEMPYYPDGIGGTNDSFPLTNDRLNFRQTNPDNAQSSSGNSSKDPSSSITTTTSSSLSSTNQGNSSSLNPSAPSFELLSIIFLLSFLTLFNRKQSK